MDLNALGWTPFFAEAFASRQQTGFEAARVAAEHLDVDLFATRCRFTDCQHDTEPGCALRGAVESGELDAARLESHRKLVVEMRYLERKQDPVVQAAEGRRIKSITKSMRADYRTRR